MVTVAQFKPMAVVLTSVCNKVATGGSMLSGTVHVDCSTYCQCCPGEGGFALPKRAVTGHSYLNRSEINQGASWGMKLSQFYSFYSPSGVECCSSHFRHQWRTRPGYQTSLLYDVALYGLSLVTSTSSYPPEYWAMFACLIVDTQNKQLHRIPTWEAHIDKQLSALVRLTCLRLHVLMLLGWGFTS